MVIVDSSVWIDYLHNVSNPQTSWLDAHLELEEIGLTTLTLCEVLQGLRTPIQVTKTTHHLLAFSIFDGCDRALALTAAESFRFLRSRGVTVRSTIDSLLATFCIARWFPLLHRDRDFDAFETHLGLDVIKP